MQYGKSKKSKQFLHRNTPALRYRSHAFAYFLMFRNDLWVHHYTLLALLISCVYRTPKNRKQSLQKSPALDIAPVEQISGNNWNAEILLAGFFFSLVGNNVFGIACAFIRGIYSKRLFSSTTIQRVDELQNTQQQNKITESKVHVMMLHPSKHPPAPHSQRYCTV